MSGEKSAATILRALAELGKADLDELVEAACADQQDSVCQRTMKWLLVISGLWGWEAGVMVARRLSSSVRRPCPMRAR